MRATLGEICAKSDAEVAFDKMTFSVTGSDDSVKAALKAISEMPFTSHSQHQIKVKLELALEHKEFVSGKKNGKINKIMGQSKLSSYLLRFFLVLFVFVSSS
jgi:hypothetical protein